MSAEARNVDSLDRLRAVRRPAMLTGIAALVIAFLYVMVNPAQFFQSYLLAYMYWLAFAVGCLPLLGIDHLVEGRWGLVIRRWLEAGLRTTGLLALFFLPLLAGLPHLYPWAQSGAAEDPLIAHKSAYLNIPFFVVRAVAYFLVWGALAHYFIRWSADEDASADGRSKRKLQLLSGPAILLYALAITFASVDWVMSLEPVWFSTIYGILFMVGQTLTALAFVIVVLAAAARSGPLSMSVRDSDFHDLGNLLLAFVSLWAYVSFSQYLIIWSGNLPEEVTWYHSRTGPGWQWLAAALILFHFAVPFVLLLSRRSKRDLAILQRVALAVLVARALDLYWFIIPALRPEGGVHWLDAVALLGIGGLWIALFVTEIARRPLLPRQDVQMSGSAVHEGGLP
jgi:hypothetical protein